MQKVAEQAAEEARYYMQTTGNKRHALVMRAPNADLARDPRWGRTEESSEKMLSQILVRTFSSDGRKKLMRTHGK